MSAMTLDITRLGAEGDGIAETANGPVYVPFAHPGDRLKVAVEKSQGTIMAITEPSPDRIAPVCRHFGPDGENGACGGCSLQHVNPALYAEFKRGLVVNALKSKASISRLARWSLHIPASAGGQSLPHARRRRNCCSASIRPAAITSSIFRNVPC